jgi:isocitrate dehydrogenase
MMLEYMGWKEAAQLIVNALEKAFSKGEATHDLARFMPNGHALGTNEFGQKIISLL